MTKFNSINLDSLMEEFSRLEQRTTQLCGEHSLMELRLHDVNRRVHFYQNKETSLTEERDSLSLTVSSLQQSLQEQCRLREENERLKGEVADLKRHNDKMAEDGEAEVQRLLAQMTTEEDRHKGELEAVRQQCRSQVEDAHREVLHQLEVKDGEVEQLLEQKDVDLEEMRRRLKDQERERQSELLKLQMEFGAKLARVQSSAQWSQQQQQQQHGSSLLPQSVFKRKLQIFQEEKNKEIAALRQRVKELEELQRGSVANDNRLKRRKV